MVRILLDVAYEHSVWYAYGTQENQTVLCTFTMSEIVVVELVATGSNYHCSADPETAAGF